MKKINKYFYFLTEAQNLKSFIGISLYIIKIFLYPFYWIFKINFHKELPLNITIKNKNGTYFCGKSPSSIWLCSLLGEKEIQDYFDLKDGVFIDIGANIGKYTIKIANQLKERGKVISIEPELENVKIIRKNIKLNNLKNVYIIDKGCSYKNDIIKLYKGNDNSSYSILDKGLGLDIVEIVVEKLDKIIQDLNLKRVDFIKIDVEGVEELVLKGAINTLKIYHPKIIFECDNQKSLENIKNILNPLNYKIKKINSTNYFGELK